MTKNLDAIYMCNCGHRAVTRGEQWKHKLDCDAGRGKPAIQPAEPMTADECAEALSVAEYTAECFFSGSITELADDPTFKRLVKLARAAEWDTANALAKLNEAQAEAEWLRARLQEALAEAERRKQ